MTSGTPSVAGIDLSGREPKPPRHTAVAWLSLDSPPRLLQLAPDDDALRAFIGPKGDNALRFALRERRPHTIAIDAPLTLPHAVLCEAPDCGVCLPADGSDPASYTRRDVEIKTPKRWNWLPRSPMTTAQLAALTFRARWLARAFAQDGMPRSVETYPAAVYRRLADNTNLAHAEKLNADDRLALLRMQAHIQGLEEIDTDAPATDDRVDAVSAAYVAWCHHHGKAEPVEGHEGTIWLPAAPT